MALPFIAGGIVAGKFVHDMMEADKNNEKAQCIAVRAANQQAEAEAKNRLLEKEFNNSVEKLANRKRAVLKSSFPRFKDVYSQIMKIQFNNDSRGIKELFSLNNIGEYNQQLGNIMAIEPMQLSDKQLVSSFLVGGVKGILLGGIFGGVVIGATNSIVKESELNVSTANAQKRQARLYAEAVEAKKDAVEAVCWHLDQVSDILAKLNVLFLKNIKASSGIIEKNGYSSLNYTDEELGCLGTCMNLAQAVKTIVDTPIIDENNRVVAAAKEVIVTGQTFIEEFNQIV